MSQQPAAIPQTPEDEAGMWEAKARDAFVAGDFTASRRYFERELAIRRALGGREQTVYALIHAATAMQYEQQWDAAVAHDLLEEAMELAQQIGTQRYIGPVRANLAGLALHEGDYATALAIAQECLPIWKSFPDPDGTCYLLETIALAAANLGRAEDAVRLHAAATASREGRGTRHFLPAFLAEHERMLAPAHAQLGPRRSAEVEAEGRELPLDEAVDYALRIQL